MIIYERDKFYEHIHILVSFSSFSFSELSTMCVSYIVSSYSSTPYCQPDYLIVMYYILLAPRGRATTVDPLFS